MNGKEKWSNWMMKNECKKFNKEKNLTCQLIKKWKKLLKNNKN